MIVYGGGNHSDVSVFDDNFGDTGWDGLATIESTELFNWNHITHAHARLNTYYVDNSPYNNAWERRAIFCQEIGHTFGLDHDDTGSCMGFGYFSNATNTINGHNTNDVYNKYRYSHH